MILNKVLYGDVTVLSVITAAAVILVSFFAAKAATLYLRRAIRDKINPDHLAIISKVIYYGIIIAAAVMVLPNLGLRLSGLLVAGGIVGVAIGFASQSVVGNLVSGIFLILERPVRIGNAVKIGDTVGIVENIHIMSTTLRTFDGLFVRIPNQKVFTTDITNFVANVARRFEYTVGIRYSDDAERAIRVIKEIIDGEPFALQYPEPLVFVDDLGDNSVDIAVKIWAPVSKWYGLKMKMLWKIKKTLESEGIQVPFPQRVVWFAKDEPDAVDAVAAAGGKEPHGEENK